MRLFSPSGFGRHFVGSLLIWMLAFFLFKSVNKTNTIDIVPIRKAFLTHSKISILTCKPFFRYFAPHNNPSI